MINKMVAMPWMAGEFLLLFNSYFTNFGDENSLVELVMSTSFYVEGFHFRA
jgi:hypothetical protein